MTGPDAGLRCLVAEDNDINRKVILAMVRSIAGVVDEALNGEQAVAMAASGAYHVILMDVRMPKVDGLSAIRAIRALPAPACDVPIVVVTADAVKSNCDVCVSAGADAYVAKPIDMQTLFAAIGRAMSERKHRSSGSPHATRTG